MKKELSYDQLKKMLNTIRNYQTVGISKHNIFENKTDSMVLDGNVEIKIHSSDNLDLKLSDNEKNSLNQLISNFKSQVTNNVDFSVGFNIYSTSVRLDGKIGEDISFVYLIGDDSGVYVNCNMIQLDSENTNIFKKLLNFYKIYETTTIKLMETRKNN